MRKTVVTYKNDFVITDEEANSPLRSGGGKTFLKALGNTVAENASGGTVISTLSVVGSAYVQPAVYSIAPGGDPSGLFEVVGNELRVKAGAEVDFETATSHSVELQAVDDVPNTYPKTVNVMVTNVNEDFVDWIAPGDPTDHGFRINVGLTLASAAVSMIVSLSADFSDPVIVTNPVASVTKTYAVAPTSQASAILAVDVLQPKTKYYVGFKSGSDIDSTIYRFETLPLEGSPAAFTITYGSCSREILSPVNSDVYTEIAKIQNSPVFIQNGDWHYKDPQNVSTAASVVRAAIRDWLKLSKVRAMIGGNSTAHGGALGDIGKFIIHGPDDHDFFGPNDSSMSSPNYFTGGPQVILGIKDMLPLCPLMQPDPATEPAETRPYTRGMAQEFRFADVYLPMLDCRSFKANDSQNAGAGTMLGDGTVKHGARTWNGLQALKDAITAEVGVSALCVILSSTTWTYEAHTGWSDEAAAEQRNLVDYLKTLDIENIILYGDQHAQTLSDGRATTPGKLENFTTGGDGIFPNFGFSGLLCVPIQPGVDRHHWAGATQEASSASQTFGVVDIDTTGDEVQYTARAISSTGAVTVGPVSKNDVTPEVEFAAASLTPSISEESNSIVLTIERDWLGQSSGIFTTVDVTAEAGTDFGAPGNDAPVTGTFSFRPNSTTTTITIPILDRDVTEQGNLSFTVELASVSGCTIGANGTATVEILDADVTGFIAPNPLTSKSVLFNELVGDTATLESYAPPAGANKFATVEIALEQLPNPGFGVLSVEWNGKVLTPLGLQVNPTVTTNPAHNAVYLFGLLNANFPASAGDVVVKFTQDLVTNANDVSVAILVVEGARQLMPTNFVGSQSTGVNLTTPEDNELIINGISEGSNGNANIALIDGQVVRQQRVETADFSMTLATLVKATAGLQSLRYTPVGTPSRSCSTAFSLRGV